MFFFEVLKVTGLILIGASVLLILWAMATADTYITYEGSARA